ncbi:hypothetical protein SEA_SPARKDEHLILY_72 [Mycobacterium phage Sparkdehlily]|uniref:Uncharacterized protein n=1 Tax=Mycobacterium phage Sparkdehlily TaxID=1739966 RepID=A0A0S1S1D0_9CAUD|nr:hypothetical protein SEA_SPARKDEHLILY_72 [Mycobacterium phage Sparkdehlily]ALM02221.1 hypothetical protein SEA_SPARKDEHLILY_72 [Mycobacterium phage Sparkdehlily]
MNAATSMPQTLLHTIAGPVVLADLAAMTPTWRPTGCGLVAPVIVGRSPIGRKLSLTGGLFVNPSPLSLFPSSTGATGMLLDDDGFVYRIPNPVEATR